MDLGSPYVEKSQRSRGKAMSRRLEMKRNLKKPVRATRYLALSITLTMFTVLLSNGNAPLFAAQAQQAPTDSVRIPADQLDALVAPIALYPDPLLSQTLVASTYPLELMQLQQWLERNP